MTDSLDQILILNYIRWSLHLTNIYLSYYYISGIVLVLGKWTKKQTNILILTEPIFNEEWQNRRKEVICHITDDKHYCCCLVAKSCPTFWDPMKCSAAHQASLSFTVSQSLLKLMSIESVMPSNHLIICLPLLLLSSIFPSIRVFSSKLALHIRWPIIIL